MQAVRANRKSPNSLTSLFRSTAARLSQRLPRPHCFGRQVRQTRRPRVYDEGRLARARGKQVEPTVLSTSEQPKSSVKSILSRRYRDLVDHGRLHLLGDNRQDFGLQFLRQGLDLVCFGQGLFDKHLVLESAAVDGHIHARTQDG